MAGFEELSWIERRLDKLWSALVAHEFDYRCFMCGQPGADAHHWVYGRNTHKYRWCIKNGIYLCRICHDKARADNGQALETALAKRNPKLIEWRDTRGPLIVEPITTSGMLFLTDSHEREVTKRGITVDGCHVKETQCVPNEINQAMSGMS